MLNRIKASFLINYFEFFFLYDCFFDKMRLRDRIFKILLYDFFRFILLMIYVLFNFFSLFIKDNLDRTFKYITSFIFILFLKIDYIDNIKNLVIYVERLIKIKYI